MTFRDHFFYYISTLKIRFIISNFNFAIIENDTVFENNFYINVNS